LVRRAGLRLAGPPLERDEPLLDRAALLRLRVDAAVFERDEPLAFVLDPEPFAELFLLLLLEAGLLLVAILHLSIEGVHPLRGAYPVVGALIFLQGFLHF
jgi:hypothetical protein